MLKYPFLFSLQFSIVQSQTPASNIQIISVYSLFFIIEENEEADLNGPARRSISSAIVVLEASVGSASNAIGARIIILEHDNLLRCKAICVAVDVIRMEFEEVVVGFVVLRIVGPVNSGSVLRVVPVWDIASIDNKQGPGLDGDPDWSPYIDDSPALVCGNKLLGRLFSQFTVHVINGSGVVVVDMHRRCWLGNSSLQEKDLIRVIPGSLVAQTEVPRDGLGCPSLLQDQLLQLWPVAVLDHLLSLWRAIGHEFLFGESSWVGQDLVTIFVDLWRRLLCSNVVYCNVVDFLGLEVGFAACGVKVCFTPISGAVEHLNDTGGELSLRNNSHFDQHELC